MLYSIQAGASQNATAALHGIAIEEMLHMGSFANIINAVGGRPDLRSQSFAPVYPLEVAFLNVSLDLLPFSLAQVEKFRRIEEPMFGFDRPGRHTVHFFYERIIDLMEILVLRYGEAAVFSGDPKLQVNV